MHVYLHVPFCARRCSYCDFAIAVRREVPSAAYVDALLREWAALAGPRHLGRLGRSGAAVVETLYFGGGTPSLLDPGAIARILAQVAADRPVAPDAEVTLEANPDDVTAEAARAVAGGRHQPRLARRAVVRSRRARLDASHPLAPTRSPLAAERSARRGSPSCRSI